MTDDDIYLLQQNRHLVQEYYVHDTCFLSPSQSELHVNSSSKNSASLLIQHPALSELSVLSNFQQRLSNVYQGLVQDFLKGGGWGKVFKWWPRPPKGTPFLVTWHATWQKENWNEVSRTLWSPTFLSNLASHSCVRRCPIPIPNAIIFIERYVGILTMV